MEKQIIIPNGTEVYYSRATYGNHIVKDYNSKTNEYLLELDGQKFWVPSILVWRTDTSIVRNNLLTVRGYKPYCGNNIARHLPDGCDNPRTVFNGKQFKCNNCGYETKFEEGFIQQVKNFNK